MTIDSVLIVDTETTGLDPREHAVIEIGCVWWSVSLGMTLATWSELIVHHDNPAMHINGILVEGLYKGLLRSQAFDGIKSRAARADVIVAHRAEFDSAFLPDLGKPWICSKTEIDWPRAKRGESLVPLALAHGVALTSAHRALTDCLTLARLFERCAEMGHSVHTMLERAMRPKKKMRALVSFEEKDKAKDLGFLWEPKSKVWWRNVFDDEVAELPFKVVPL